MSLLINSASTLFTLLAVTDALGDFAKAQATSNTMLWIFGGIMGSIVFVGFVVMVITLCCREPIEDIDSTSLDSYSINEASRRDRLELRTKINSITQLEASNAIKRANASSNCKPKLINNDNGVTCDPISLEEADISISIVNESRNMQESDIIACAEINPAINNIAGTA